MPSPLSILQSYWGYPAFRPMQEDIIQTILKGKDVLALMPTGGGKSICFQVPAMAKEGLCLVVSPLIALMKDQVENLRKKGITAFAVYSGMSRKEVAHILKLAGNSNCKFLYVSPERLETAMFKEYLPGLPVNLVAVDEAHCISQWGYDFRPPYLRIAKLRDELPAIPVLALTASATPEVQEDICLRLGFQEKVIFRQSFERPNLSYSVFHVDSPINKIMDILSNVKGSGIVYCRSRKRCQEIAGLLRLQGVSADYYHAGLSSELRSSRQEAWIQNRIRVIVCTNAFGMGIDKADVRVVIHADLPECLENYYQEAGRAGRDGRRSYAVLLFQEKAVEDLEKLPTLRFPKLNEIRVVYRALMNYLQVPAGNGLEQYFDFDISDFTAKFGLDTLLVTASLKTLEQEDYLSFNEQVFLPSRVQVTGTRGRIQEVEAASPALEPLIKALLRSYEGIFDFPVGIHESALARLLHVDVKECGRQLLLLKQMGIIEYQPQKDSPQIFFARNRVRTEDLHINESYYRRRRQLFTERIDELISYTRKITVCRSRIIASYFGDDSVPDCGICDNCLNRKKEKLSGEDLEKISQRVLALVRQKPRNIDALLAETRDLDKEKTWKVIDYLQSENRIRVDESGKIFAVA